MESPERALGVNETSSQVSGEESTGNLMKKSGADISVLTVQRTEHQPAAAVTSEACSFQGKHYHE